jgi:5-methyltetrahydrofolate--homocysteine methyltransferase
MTIKSQKSKLIVIGENINTTRRIRADNTNIVREDDKIGYVYKDFDGTRKVPDITDIFPQDPTKLKTERIAHIGQAIRKKDLSFLKWAIHSQVNAGAEIVDLCVDELSVYPEERLDYMRWTVKTAQQLADVSFALDSSDPKAIQAGLEVYDRTKSRPALNSTSLEAGRDVLMELAREHKCMLFANGSGSSGMPQNAEARVDNMTKCMELMDKAGVPVEDRYLDPLVFPVGAGPQFGRDYLDAVTELRKRFPKVHIFGGLSNVSFGLPRRKLLNDAFIRLAIMRGCDAIMIDPIMNQPIDYIEFKYAADVMTSDDEYAIQFLKYVRGNAKKTKPSLVTA